MGYCFESVLHDMLGPMVRDSVYDLLAKDGIPRHEVSNRFDDTVQAMDRVLGKCSRVVIHKTVAEMYKQYSQRFVASYQDSLRDQLSLLKETVVANHLVPRKLTSESGVDLETDKRSQGVGAAGQDYGSMYPLKRGVKAS